MTNILTRNKANRDFSRVPKIQKKRSVFPMGKSMMHCFNASYLIPINWEEVVPGDTWIMNLDAMVRMTTQIVPTMDNLYLKTYAFFVPTRLTWDNFAKQHGERKNPGDSIDYITPTVTSGENGFGFETIYDYMECEPTAPSSTVISLPFRAVMQIYNDFFRDENLIDSIEVNTSDSDDDPEDFYLLKKAKVHDYFTSALPNLQKGEQVMLPIGTSAPVVGNGMALGLDYYKPSVNEIAGAGLINRLDNSSRLAASPDAYGKNVGEAINTNVYPSTNGIPIGVTKDPTKSGLEVDLTSALGTSVSALAQLIANQRVLERDNRNGTRYTEQLAGRYGVTNPDLRLQRPQYLGGTSKLLWTNAVVQTSGTGATGEETPQGNLAGYSTFADSGNIVKASFTEWGYIIVLAVVENIPLYQQGTPRKFYRMNRFDYFYPEFENLSDQPIYNKEIYTQGANVVNEETGEPIDNEVFGYQERYSEYKYNNNAVTGKLRSTHPQSLDIWHFAEKFENLPKLNQTFIENQTETAVDRVIAIKNTEEPQFIGKFDFNSVVYRGMQLHNYPQIEARL